MNIRSKSTLKNKGNSYLSLGMGVRTTASTNGNLGLNKDETYLANTSLFSKYMKAQDLYKLYTNRDSLSNEVLNLGIEDVLKKSFEATPNNEVGLLGKIARENNLKIGVLGNSDFTSESREFTLLAMDENGLIPYGNVGSDLLMSEPSSINGMKFDQNKLEDELNRLVDQVDILFIDYGDLSRSKRVNSLVSESVQKQEIQKSLLEADRFLGKIFNKVSLEDNLYMVISPTPSKDMISGGNFGLTPVILSDPNLSGGLLTSTTTKRTGLVTNFDFGPSIFNFFDLDSGDGFIGEAIRSTETSSPEDYLIKSLDQSLYLRNYRKVFHWGFIGLIIVTLLAYFIPFFTGIKLKSTNLISYLSLTVLITPLTMITISLFGYKNIIFDIFYVFIGGLILAYLIRRITGSNLRSMAVIGLTTTFIILLDTVFIKKLMIISPLGSDAIAGGRFYGIGNDYMGILLGSSILAFFCLYELRRSKNKFIGLSFIPYLVLVMLALSPLFGANMGGVLSTMLILISSFFIIYEKDFSFKKLILIGIGAVGFIFLIAFLDSTFNPNPTHAGKAFIGLKTMGISKLIEMITIKLRQVFWNLAHASWNIVLFGQILLAIIIYRYKNKDLDLIASNYKNLSKGFTLLLFASLFIFLFNDTGTIAAAIVLYHLFIPLGELLTTSKKKPRN